MIWLPTLQLKAQWPYKACILPVQFISLTLKKSTLDFYIYSHIYTYTY